MADVEVDQRTDHDIAITIKDEAGVIVDITGFAISFYIAAHIDATPIITKTVGDGVVITDGTNGLVTVTLSDADTDLRGTYYFECSAVDGSGNKSDPVKGSVEFIASNQ